MKFSLSHIRSIYLLSSLLLLTNVSAETLYQKHDTSTNPLLVILIMVKNEKEVIIPTLETYLTQNLKAGKEDTGAVAYMLYDTGSNDETENIVQDFFEKYKIKNYVIEKDSYAHLEEFDYGLGRTNGLIKARAQFPQSTFILFPDAEWYMQNFDDLVRFCHEEIQRYKNNEVSQPHYYQVMMKKGKSLWPQQRLLMTRSDVLFEGGRHECPTKASRNRVTSSAYFELGVSKEGGERSFRRWSNDRKYFLKQLEKDPKHPRHVFYLAQTCKWLGNYLEAYNYYKMRTELSSFPEEDYFTWYYLAGVTEILAQQSPRAFSWTEALKYYLKAFSMRPHLAEPLVRIAEHYLAENNHPMSYLFARRACELELPKRENLFIFLDDYEVKRWEILSRSAWYVGEFEVGEKAAKMLIEAEPNNPQWYRNLSFYWERKK